MDTKTVTRELPTEVEDRLIGHIMGAPNSIPDLRTIDTIKCLTIFYVLKRFEIAYAKQIINFLVVSMHKLSNQTVSSRLPIWYCILASARAQEKK